jgi:predicted RNA-binding protein Jag
MSYDQSLRAARHHLRDALTDLQDEMRAYPTPVSGCDAQYNYLIGQRGSVLAALQSLEEPQFVATPRTPDIGAGIESR